MQKYKRNGDSLASNNEVEIVDAAKIEGISVAHYSVLIYLPGESIRMPHEWMEKHNPLIGGYYIRQISGYEYYLPADVFHRNYTAVAADYPIREETINTGQEQINSYCILRRSKIDLMSRIKTHGRDTDALLLLVREHLAQQVALADDIEKRRIDAAEPAKWLEIARSSLQTAQMALTRAVTQPTSF